MNNKIVPVCPPRECDGCGLHADVCRNLYNTSRFIPVGNNKMYCVECTEKLVARLQQCLKDNGHATN